MRDFKTKRSNYRIYNKRKSAFLLTIIVVLGMAGSLPAIAKGNVTYSPPDVSSLSAAQLRKYYLWREKMDWLLAPIHTRADLKKYLQATEKTGSPLDALDHNAKQRFLSSMHYSRYGAGAFNYLDLQYLSTKQVYKILALFGRQGLATEITGDRIRPASPVAKQNSRDTYHMQQRFDQLWDEIHSDHNSTRKNRMRAIEKLYKQLFGSYQKRNVVRKLGDEDLRLVFHAAYLMAFHTFQPVYAKDVLVDFMEMERRQFIGPPDYHQMYQALIRTRQYADAHKFYRQHQNVDLTPLPAYRDEAVEITDGIPTVLVVSTTKDELIRRPVDLSKAAQVIILTDPNCGFCKELSNALRSRPKLRDVLDRHAIRVALPGSELEFASLQKWNKAHPHQTVGIMYSLQGWPPIRTLATPLMLFLQHGKTVKKLVGWRGEKDLAILRDDLRAIGLFGKHSTTPKQ